MTQTTELLCEVRGQVGFITLNRPKALNALSLGMVRGLLAQLLAWRDDPAVLAVAIRGSHKEGVFGHFCAGGDIRFLHQTVQAGSPQIEDFFTEEYTLNHVIFTTPSPTSPLWTAWSWAAAWASAKGPACASSPKNPSWPCPRR